MILGVKMEARSGREGAKVSESSLCVVVVPFGVVEDVAHCMCFESDPDCVA